MPEPLSPLPPIQALRTAERVLIEITVNARGHATSTLRAEGPGATTPTVLSGLPTSITDYEPGRPRRLSARAQIAGTSEQWRTVAALLRDDDRLEIILAIDAGNPYLRKAGLHADKVGVRIHRADGASLALPLLNSITPDNFARIIQR